MLISYKQNIRYLKKISCRGRPSTLLHADWGRAAPGHVVATSHVSKKILCKIKQLREGHLM